MSFIFHPFRFLFDGKVFFHDLPNSICCACAGERDCLHGFTLTPPPPLPPPSPSPPPCAPLQKMHLLLPPAALFTIFQKIALPFTPENTDNCSVLHGNSQVFWHFFPLQCAVSIDNEQAIGRPCRIPFGACLGGGALGGGGGSDTNTEQY